MASIWSKTQLARTHRRAVVGELPATDGLGEMLHHDFLTEGSRPHKVRHGLGLESCIDEALLLLVHGYRSCKWRGGIGFRRERAVV